MKIIFRTAVLAALLITSSCGKDAVEAISNQIDEETEQLENTPLEVNSFSDNVIIAGGIKEVGDSPVPNGAISLDISKASKTALLGEGFDISFSSDGDVVGAYLRFKTEEGTVANSYYDIDVDENSEDNKSSKQTRFKFKYSNTLSTKTDETILDVDFNTTIEPGTFCYEICVYDAAGNISEPEEVCVTVESWGGSSAIVGEWNLFKEVDLFGSESITILVGEESCDDEEVLDCTSEGSFTASDYCYLTNGSSFTFNEDGSFEYSYSDVHKELKYNESKDSCEAVYHEFEHTELSKGKWAYVQETNDLILVLYYDKYTYDGESETENYVSGEDVIFAEEGIFLIDEVLRLGSGENDSENGYYSK